MSEFSLPSVENQEKLVEWGTNALKDLTNEFFPKGEEEHKPFRLMVKQLLPMMRDAPASPSIKWHGAWVGGLLAHTVTVMEMGLKLSDMLYQDVRNRTNESNDDSDAWKKDNIAWKRSIVKACFLHDIGKLGDLTEPYYLPQENEWRKDNLGEMFNINRDMEKLTYLPIPVRGLWIAQHFGVKLTPQETQAIIASDGPGTAHGKQVVVTFLEDPLTALVHFADKWVSQVRGV